MRGLNKSLEPLVEGNNSAAFNVVAGQQISFIFNLDSVHARTSAAACLAQTLQQVNSTFI